jgi:hypothetical protein
MRSDVEPRVTPSRAISCVPANQLLAILGDLIIASYQPSRNVANTCMYIANCTTRRCPSLWVVRGMAHAGVISAAEGQAAFGD